MSLMKEFREFALKGNVVDLAVGVIVGAAFGKIVESLVKNVLMPPIGYMIGGVNFAELAVNMPTPTGKPVHCLLTKSDKLSRSEQTLTLQKVRQQMKAANHDSTVQLFSSLKNPFPKLEIADMEELKGLCDQPESQAFLKQCSTVGACKALSALAAKERRQYLALLRKARASWWHPDLSWKHFGSSLEIISP